MRNTRDTLGGTEVVRFRTGDYQFDVPQRRVLVAGEEVSIQPRVFDLIVCLAQHRDRAVSRQELLDRVWTDARVSETSINQCVRAARKFLRDDAAQPRLIRTVRGHGFQWVGPLLDLAAATPGLESVSIEAAELSAVDLTDATQSETQSAAGVGERVVGHLAIALRADHPALELGSYCLHDLDEVVLMRASTPSARRRDEQKRRRLVIGLPGQAVSRRHARLVRSNPSWVIRDEGSRNGISVNGERVTKRELGAGDVIECGHTLLLFRTVAVPQEALDTRAMLPAGMFRTSADPQLNERFAALWRIASVSERLMLYGPPASGKRTLARMLAKEYPLGELVEWPLTEPAPQVGERSTVIVTGLSERSVATQDVLTSWLHSEGERHRVYLCSTVAPERLADVGFASDLVAAIAGHAFGLPGLAERLPDIGAFCRSALDGAGLKDYRFTPDAGYALLRHGWPGNLAELSRTLQAAGQLGTPPLVISRADLGLSSDLS